MCECKPVAFRWIKVEDRLPEDDRYVIVYHSVWKAIGRFVREHPGFEGRDSWVGHEDLRFVTAPTHWMELPGEPES